MRRHTVGSTIGYAAGEVNIALVTRCSSPPDALTGGRMPQERRRAGGCTIGARQKYRDQIPRLRRAAARSGRPADRAGCRAARRPIPSRSRHPILPHPNLPRPPSSRPPSHAPAPADSCGAPRCRNCRVAPSWWFSPPSVIEERLAACYPCDRRSGSDTPPPPPTSQRPSSIAKARFAPSVSRRDA